MPKSSVLSNESSSLAPSKGLLDKSTKPFYPKSHSQHAVSTEVQRPIPAPLLTLLKGKKLTVEQMKMFRDLDICIGPPATENKQINASVIKRKVEKKAVETHRRNGFATRIRRESNNNYRGKLELQAKEWLRELLKSDEGKVLKHAKGLLNKITPDNKKIIREQFKQVLQECHDSHRKGLINIFVRKAINEDKYMVIYADLVKDLGEWEYNTDLAAKHDIAQQQKKESAKTKVKKAKESRLALEIIKE